MNLRLNFIQPTELRSASMVSVRAVLIMAGIFTPLVITLLISFAYISYAEEKSAYNLAESVWKITEQRKIRAEELTRELDTLKSYAKELRGWSQTRIKWSDVLLDVQKLVPPGSQLKVLMITQALEIDPKSGIYRSVKLTLSGRCEGPDAEEKILKFDRMLKEQPSLKTAVVSRGPPTADPDTEAGSDDSDRSFQIELDFNPRYFNETAAK